MGGPINQAENHGGPRRPNGKAQGARGVPLHQALRGLDLRLLPAGQKKFLAKHAEEAATERQRLRPMRTIEEIGVECAIWPDLHWTTDTCETNARECDGRRLARIAKANDKRADSADNEDSSEDSEPEKELRRDRPWQHARDASENATHLMCPRRDQEMS